MNEKLMKAVKIIVPIASVGVTLAANFLSNKELDDKVSAKVAEALAKSQEGES